MSTSPTSGPPSRRAAGYVELLRDNRKFRALWLSEVVSFFGDWFNTIALYAAVAELTSSTEAMTGVFVAKMLPIFVMTPIAGPLIDRFDRRKLLIASDIARACCALGLVAAYHAKSTGVLICVLVLMVSFGGVFIPARMAIVPQLVEKKDLGTANALGAATWSTMLAVGAATGGLVTAAVGIELAFIIDAFTFVGSALFLVPLEPLLPSADSPSKQDGTDAASDRTFVAGLRYLRRTPYLAAIIAVKPLMALTGAGLAMLPVFATRIFGGGSGYLGILYTARGVGALIGSLAIRRIFGDTPRNMRRMIIPGFLVAGLSYAGLSQAPTIWHAALACTCATLGGSALWVFSGTLGHLESDNAFRGRVFALEMGLFTLSYSIAAASSGSLVDRLGWTARDVTLAGSCTMVLPILMWLWVLRTTSHTAPNRAQ